MYAIPPGFPRLIWKRPDSYVRRIYSLPLGNLLRMLENANSHPVPTPAKRDVKLSRRQKTAKYQKAAMTVMLLCTERQRRLRIGKENDPPFLLKNEIVPILNIGAIFCIKYLL